MKPYYQNILPERLVRQISSIKHSIKNPESIATLLEWVFRKNSISKERFIFIVGCGHSGTSIMHRLLGYHPAVFDVPNETAWFHNGLKLSDKRELLSILTLKRLFYFDFVLEKTPFHLRYIRNILEVLPESRFVVMIRDPRDVICSLMARGKTFDLSLKLWKDSAEITTRLSSMCNVKIVKLEDLVANPNECLKDLLRFCGLEEFPLLECHGKVPKYFYSSTNSRPTSVEDGENHRKNRNWQINQELFESTERWRSELNESQLNIINSELSRLADSLGYRI